MNEFLEASLLKYSIRDKGIFLEIIKNWLSGQMKDEQLAYNFQKSLDLDLNSALNLSSELINISDKDKKTLAEDLKKKEDFDLGAQIRNISKDLGINLDKILFARLMETTTSFLKEVRDAKGFKDSLQRPAKIGGMGFSEKQADNFIEALTKKRTELAAKNIDLSKVAAESSGVSAIEESEIDVSAKVKQVSQPLAESQGVGIHELLKEKGIDYGELKRIEKIKRDLGGVELVPEAGADFANEIVEEEEFLESKKEIPAPPPLPSAPKPISTAPKIEVREQPILRKLMPQSRPRMDDVKVSEPQLYGPVDELASLTIADFRRLSKDPKESVIKLIGKLDLLEDESLAKKADGVRALKSSPLYKLYAQIMNEAMTQSKPIEQVINESNSISLPEFKAIMSLNQNLKY